MLASSSGWRPRHTSPSCSHHARAFGSSLKSPRPRAPSSSLRGCPMVERRSSRVIRAGGHRSRTARQSRWREGINAESSTSVMTSRGESSPGRTWRAGRRHVDQPSRLRKPCQIFGRTGPPAFPPISVDLRKSFGDVHAGGEPLHDDLQLEAPLIVWGRNIDLTALEDVVAGLRLLLDPTQRGRARGRECRFDAGGLQQLAPASPSARNDDQSIATMPMSRTI